MKCEDLCRCSQDGSHGIWIEKPFHIAADSIRETDSINKGVYEENPFLVELKPRVRTYREKTRSSIIGSKEKKWKYAGSCWNSKKKKCRKYASLKKWGK